MGHRLVSVSVAALVVVTVGCSDDKERLSTADFLEQGNAICEEGNAEIDAVIEDVELGPDGQPSMETIVEVYEDTILPSVRSQVEELGDLVPPEDLEDDVEALLDDADAALDDMAQQLEDDAEAFVSAGEDPFAEVNAQATELGLTACGE